MEFSGLGSLRGQAPNANSRSRRGIASSHACASTTGGGTDRSIESRRDANGLRLIADQRYFGLEARHLRAGAERVLMRLSAQSPGPARIDVRHLAEDFRLATPASWTLLRALLAGGLVHPDGHGGYRPTPRFREYASASLVAPLARERAKALIRRACEQAAQINADWTRNPFRIKAIAVSGSYMSRRKELPELSLWLVLHRRAQARARRWLPAQSNHDALHQILTTVHGLSSFIVVRVATDTLSVPRPFSIVFQASEDVTDAAAPAFERLRNWTVSIGRRIAV